MIRMVGSGNTGWIVFLGVTEENVVRLKAGEPIDVDIKELMAGLGGAQPARVVISYGARHVDVVGDMQRGGLPIGEDALEQARRLDAQLEREGRLAPRVYRHSDADTTPPVASQPDGEPEP